MASHSADDCSVADIARCRVLDNSPVATYAAVVRGNGRRPIGVLGIHFNWSAQAEAVVRDVRLSPAEAKRTRVLLVDANDRVIAASDRNGMPDETLRLEHGGRASGSCRDSSGNTVAFHRMPSYEINTLG
jgi:hypothetical protein